MISSTECRANARHALEQAGLSKPLKAEQWQQNAREWTALAVMIDGQEVLIQNLIDRTSG